MNCLFKLIILINLLFPLYSSDFNISSELATPEELNLENKLIEMEIRKGFAEKKIFVNPPMKNNELLCKCNHFGCHKEITDLLGNIERYGTVCRAHNGGQCRRMIHFGKDNKIKEVVLSCVHNEQLVPKERPFFCQSVNTTQLVQIVSCCKDGSFCNDRKFSIEKDNSEDENDENLNSSFWYLILLFGVSVLFSGFGLCIGIYFGATCVDRIKKAFDNCFNYLRHFYIQHFRYQNNNLPMGEVYRGVQGDEEEDQEEYDQFIESNGEKRKLKKLIRDLESVQNSISTGSGAGMPILVRRTIAWQITLKECIGRGRFGEVYLGVWRAEKVAVKIFLSRDEPSWQRETDIYRHNMLRHSNLLRWIGSDTKDAGSTTQLWLVTEYLPNGSLYDFLEQNKITLEMNIQFIRSIAHGLAYLHSELPGINNQCHKPGIAHRDIKSRNILIKNDWTCCIADLGMAIRYGNGVLDIPLQDRGGTVRYLAPEFLSNTYVRDSFNSYLQMDVYAFSLIMWETCRRTQILNLNILAELYEIPYYEYVPREPLIEQMYQVVVIEGKRPQININWKRNESLNELIRIMTECWSSSPKSRNTALNIRCSLDRICEEQKIKIIT